MTAVSSLSTSRRTNNNSMPRPLARPESSERTILLLLGPVGRGLGAHLHFQLGLSGDRRWDLHGRKRRSRLLATDRQHGGLELGLDAVLVLLVGLAPVLLRRP